MVDIFASDDVFNLGVSDDWSIRDDLSVYVDSAKMLEQRNSFTYMGVKLIADADTDVDALVEYFLNQYDYQVAVNAQNVEPPPRTAEIIQLFPNPKFSPSP